ncbi:MAG: FCD domain-containing protein [Cyclobacteriaceae bacterium]
MAELTELTKKTVNKLLDFINKSNQVPMILPSEKKMSDMLQVSRTTMLKALTDLEEKKIARQEHHAVLVLRLPIKDDYYDKQELVGTKSQIVENYILDRFTNNGLKPGDKFSELQLAKEINANTVTVREVLLKISASGLISKNPRQKWEVISITADTIKQISEYRQLLELHAIQYLVNGIDNKKIEKFCQDLLAKHESILNSKDIKREKIIELENSFHKGIIKHTNNKFIIDNYDSLFLLIKYHLRQRIMTSERFRLVLIEHINVLKAVLEKDLKKSKSALQEHFDASKKFFFESNKL